MSLKCLERSILGTSWDTQTPKEKDTMCLNTINRDFQPIAEEVIRYKVFEMVDGKPNFPFKHFDYYFFDSDLTNLSNLLNGNWLRAKPKSIFSADLREYTSGFHVFKTFEDAVLYTNYIFNGESVFAGIFKVACKNVHTEGTEASGIPTQVADEMKVLEQMT